MQIFLTGGSGFLGKAVLKNLVNKGIKIKAMSRSNKSDDLIKSLGAEPIRGDLHDIEVFADHLQGCDAVVHCAAPVKFWGPWEDFSKGIVQATLSLANEAKSKGIKKFIHVSSESVLQDGKPLLNIDENYPYPLEASSYYGESKKQAEQKLLQLEGEMQKIVIRPPFIYGPGCHAYQELFEAVNSGMFKWVDGSRHSMEAIHVENLAHAIGLALTKNVCSGVYFVSDLKNYSAKEFFTKIFEQNNVTAPKKSMPLSLLKPIACVLDKTWRVFGIRSKPPITRFDLEFISLPRRYKIDKFVEVTGYKPVV